ncbi:PAS domain-containing sensor histidine kinase [Tepidibacter hydrothermalis]|uniref:histidine kinase n=1 Tax=Tepidibacter hydrothermalis TaxID=3036126 RepID=A0ABY8EEY7_9FIRM|nr:PAS domain-containing sensor histidine kinase [Tepidibacter hydrothermalis]WFD11496.1 PAS domain-containing sensor histidine kinase [Tepidibacter hydrothermalis]
MKLEKVERIQIIVFNLINCLAVLLGLICYSYEIKLNYITVIGGVILLLVLNILSIIINLKTKAYIKEIEDKLCLFEEIVETSPNAIFVHRKLKFEYLNKKAADVFGLKNQKDAVGKPVEKFVKFNIDEIGQERYEAAKEGRHFEPVTEEIFFMENGELIDMEIFTNNMCIQGNNYALVLCRNVIEKKKILELKEKVYLEEKKLREKIQHDKIKDEFFANLSHELRTPLTIILGTIQLFENTSESFVLKQNKKFKTLKQNGYRLLRLINNLIDITKIDAGYFDINMDKYNIVSVVEDITSSVIDYVENKGLYIEFDTEVEEKIVNCHIESIDRIILNLLSNAVKFTPEGGSIFVNIFDEGENVKIVIKDTGIGIKEENINLVFDRFRQVDKSFTRNHEGSGIGLSIVKSLVEMQGGTIYLSSEYGKGSEFVITLPVEEESTNPSSNLAMEKEDYMKQKVNIEFSDIYNLKIEN